MGSVRMSNDLGSHTWKEYECLYTPQIEGRHSSRPFRRTHLIVTVTSATGRQERPSRVIHHTRTRHPSMTVRPSSVRPSSSNTVQIDPTPPLLSVTPPLVLVFPWTRVDRRLPSSRYLCPLFGVLTADSSSCLGFTCTGTSPFSPRLIVRFIRNEDYGCGPRKTGIPIRRGLPHTPSSPHVAFRYDSHSCRSNLNVPHPHRRPRATQLRETCYGVGTNGSWLVRLCPYDYRPSPSF